MARKNAGGTLPTVPSSLTIITSLQRNFVYAFSSEESISYLQIPFPAIDMTRLKHNTFELHAKDGVLETTHMKMQLSKNEVSIIVTSTTNNEFVRKGSSSLDSSLKNS